MARIPITPQGFVKLEQEIDHLKTVERPNIIKSIQQAREFGDLSENADYSAAKEKQSFIEGRILDREALKANVEVIRHKADSSDENPNLLVSFGACVSLKDVDTEKVFNYTIVSDYEADINKNLISVSSPLGRSMIGFAKDDVIEIEGSNKNYLILKVEYKAHND